MFRNILAAITLGAVVFWVLIFEGILDISAYIDPTLAYYAVYGLAGIFAVVELMTVGDMEPVFNFMAIISLGGSLVFIAMTYYVNTIPLWAQIIYLADLVVWSGAEIAARSK